jgi:hypothetical protein
MPGMQKQIKKESVKLIVSVMAISRTLSSGRGARGFVKMVGMNWKFVSQSSIEIFLSEEEATVLNICKTSMGQHRK